MVMRWWGNENYCSFLYQFISYHYLVYLLSSWFIYLLVHVFIFCYYQNKSSLSLLAYLIYEFTLGIPSGYGGSLWSGAGGCGLGRRGEMPRPEMVMPFVTQGLWRGSARWWVVNTDFLHPGKLTWNLKRMVSKRNLLFQGSIFRFHISFRGSTWRVIPGLT